MAPMTSSAQALEPVVLDVTDADLEDAFLAVMRDWGFRPFLNGQVAEVTAGDVTRRLRERGVSVATPAS